MSFEVISISSSLIEKQAITEIEKCNEFTVEFGLALSPSDAAELVETRNITLRSNGRIEFGSGDIQKIIREICDYP